MMPGESQDDFLKRVSAALAVRGEPVSLPDDLEIARVVRPEQDIVAEFAARAEQAKMIVHRVADESALVEKTVEVLRQVGATSAVVPDDGLPGRAGIVERLGREGIKLVDADEPDGAFSADAGITGVDMAVAETASLCLTSGGGRRRLASLAVPTHIGVVRAEQIVPDLLDWAAQTPAQPPACQTLVSAPSKTADIELILVMGVHGPRHEHVIIVG
jgi:L-lactate dehydrogenase complex protein LldG